MLLFTMPVLALAPQTSGADALPAKALANSPSLYLREAAAGAVRWQPWNETTLTLARTLNRPMLIDIGAVWCHWCHVMDETTYADAEVAHLLNASFVPVKIDSDQRPDLDGYYQDAASRLSGAGGWPLTCFTMPNGALFLAFGYMPPRHGEHGEPGMAAVLGRVAQVYANRGAGLEKEAAQAMKDLAPPRIGLDPGIARSPALYGEIAAALLESYDSRHGGFGEGGGPRFYDFPALELALAHGFHGHNDFTKLALDSLGKIARGGVYDQLGGGFHRYSTDPSWGVPHFEKMLYDQAMALDAYTQAAQVSGDPEYARIARGIADYVRRTLLDAQAHAFYSHQDADAFSGDDGSYYTWTRDEIARVLKGDQLQAAIAYFGIDRGPARAPDGRIVLRRALEPDLVALQVKVSPEKARALIADASATMLAARERRKRPRVDQAVLIDRNALMAAAFLAAAPALKDQELARIALDDLDYLRAHARDADGSYFHVISDSQATVSGLLADQAFMVRAMLAAYQSTGRSTYLTEAGKLADLVLKEYRDPASGLLRDRIAREAGTVLAQSGGGSNVLYDRPMPSPQAVMASAMQTLAALTGEKRYAEEAAKLLAPASTRVNPQAAALIATLGLALEIQAGGEAVVAIVGASTHPRTNALLSAALGTYRPGKVVMPLDAATGVAAQLPATARAMFDATRDRSAPMAFVCAGSACANPVSAPEQLMRTMREFNIAPVASGGAS